MKPRTSFLMRSLALALALVLLVSSMNLGAALQVFAVGNGKTHVTAGELVADNYELTDAEKALLSSGMLEGESYSYTVPVDSELITVDTENATITAENSGEWIPTTAYIVAGGEVVETITLVDGTGSYDPAVGNAFSVKVLYELYQEVPANQQETLLKTPGWIKQSMANLAAGYAGTDTNLGTVVLAMDTLKKLADGITMDFGGFSMTAKFGADAIAAVNDLRAQTSANDGTLDLQDANAAYNASAYKVGYMLESGKDYKDTLTATYESLLAIKNDPLANNTLLDEYLANADNASYTKWMAFKSILGNLVSAMEPVVNADWTGAEKAETLINWDTVEYPVLNELVAALGEISAVPEVKNPLKVDETTIQKNLSMFNVTVKVVLETVKDNEVVVYDTKTEVVTLAEGATAAEIREAVEATGLVSGALVEWANVYAEEHYNVTETELPTEGLYADVDYTITYSPKYYTVTFTYAETIEVPYGYKVTLPVHEDATKAYDYLVNGEPYAQGMTVTIEGNTDISRSSGKAYATTDLYAVVADNYGNDAVKAILKSGALKGNSVINVRKPDPADAESLLTLVDGVLTAEGYAAAYNNLNWVPYTYGEEGTENRFDGNTAPWAGKSVKVQYILKLTNFSVSEVAAALELAKTLKEEATEQKTTLDNFLSNKDAMGQLDKVKLGALNGVIDVTDFTPGDGTDTDAANLEMRAYFKGLVSGIINNNLASDGYLKIYNMLGEYETEGLRYYYENNVAFIAEIESLAEYLHGMLEDEAKVEALRIMVSAAGFPEYAEKIADLDTKLNNVLDSLSKPNEAIDLRSDKLGALITALTSEEAVACQPADTAYLLSETLTALDESQVMVQIIIDTPKGGATVTSAEMEKGTVLTQAVINDLKAKAEAKAAELLGANAKYYTLSVEGDLDALVGTAISANVNVYYTYTATEYTVVIGGEADQIVTIEDLEINLPKHPTAGWVYEYTVDGVEGITASTYTFTAEQLDRLFVNGSYTITRKEINEAVEKLEKMVADLNEAVGAGKIVLVSENGSYTGIEANIAVGDMENFVMGLVNAGYTYIGLNNEGLLYMNQENTLELSLQTLINAVLHDNTFGSETVITLGNNGKGKLVTTSMQLGNSADDIHYEDLDFTLNLTSVPSQMGTVANALTRVRNYMTFESVDGVMQINLNLPEKVYEAYLAVMLATGHVDKSDTTAVNSAIAFNFLYDYIDLILNSDATTTSFTNTLAKLGQDIDLTGYEGYYQKVKSFLTSDNVEISGEEDFTVSLDVAGKSAIDKLLALVGMDTTGLETYLGMIKEYKPGNNIAATVVATLGNTDIEFGVAVVDIKNESLTNKADFAKVGASVARINALAGEAAVMLLSDLEGNLVFNHTTVLDLNGKTLTGNITANATVYIIDSSMDTVNCGGVNGNISGNVKIIAGNYTQDVSNYLAKGYVWNNGPVSNALYTITAVKDVAGNITDVTFNINSDVYKNVEGYIPSVKALGVDIAADLVLNYFTAAAMSVDGDTLYAVDVEDVFALLEGNRSQKLENLVNEALSWIYMDTGITNFINNIIADMLNFEHIAEAIYNNEAVASYEITTKPWKVTVAHVADGDYITVGVTNNAEMAKTFNLNLVISGDAAKTHVAPLAEELGEIITDETHITVALTQPTFADKTLATIGGTVEAVVAADLTVDSDYTTVIGVVLAYGNADRAAEFVEAINAEDMDALKLAFDNTTVEEVFTALKKLSRNVNFATMASKLGVEIDTADAAKLEKVYHLVLCGAGKILEKLDITGYTDKKMGYLYDAETGYYTLSKLNVNRNGDVSYGGYTAEFDATITEVTLKVKIFGEETCLIGDVNHDGEIDVMDAGLVQQYLAEMDLDVFCFRGADVNGDEEITVDDAGLIRQYVAEIISVFPAETN